jgi:hypothetical protein
MTSKEQAEETQALIAELESTGHRGSKRVDAAKKRLKRIEAKLTAGEKDALGLVPKEAGSYTQAEVQAALKKAGFSDAKARQISTPPTGSKLSYRVDVPKGAPAKTRRAANSYAQAFSRLGQVGAKINKVSQILTSAGPNDLTPGTRKSFESMLKGLKSQYDFQSGVAEKRATTAIMSAPDLKTLTGLMRSIAGTPLGSELVTNTWDKAYKNLLNKAKLDDDDQAASYVRALLDWGKTDFVPLDTPEGLERYQNAWVNLNKIIAMAGGKLKKGNPQASADTWAQVIAKYMHPSTTPDWRSQAMERIKKAAAAGDRIAGVYLDTLGD